MWKRNGIGNEKPGLRICPLLSMKTSSELEAVTGNCPVASIIIILAHSNYLFAKGKGVIMIEKYMHPRMSKLGCT